MQTALAQNNTMMCKPSTSFLKDCLTSGANYLCSADGRLIKSTTFSLSIGQETVVVSFEIYLQQYLLLLWGFSEVGGNPE